MLPRRRNASLAEKLLRLASFLLLRVALQLFLQLLVLYHLIGALPDLFYIGFRPVEVPSQPGGYFHVHQLLSVHERTKPLL